MSFSYDDHNIHLSVCDVEQKTNEEIEITFNVFFDDLQSAMGLKPGEELPKKYKGSDALITEFIEQNVEFIINGAKVEWEYEESQLASPSVWTTITITDIKASEVKQFEIVNSILLSTYKDQKNVINFDLQGKKESFLLDRKKKSAKFSI